MLFVKERLVPLGVIVARRVVVAGAIDIKNTTEPVHGAYANDGGADVDAAPALRSVDGRSSEDGNAYGGGGGGGGSQNGGAGGVAAALGATTTDSLLS